MFFKAALLSILLVASVSSENILKFYKTDFVFNHDYVENGTCNLKVVDRNTILANVEYDLVLKMTNVTAQFQMFKFYSQFRPFLINSWFNLCQLIRNKDSYNFFVKLLYRIVAKTTNSFKCNHEVRKCKN